ncbi:MAG: type II toxin-antitoxin system HicB family antitoxin [bacterium]|nr:type II toxin-antitoxin system HicB family antitoxin [bacterium]
MTYDVLVENEQERSYTATLLGWPKLSVSGATREEALGKLRATLERRLAKAEIVSIEVDSPDQPNPWLRLSGVYRDHPLFEELLGEMEADRRDLDAEATP